jgi:hypothetical protein
LTIGTELRVLGPRPEIGDGLKVRAPGVGDPCGVIT